MSARLITNYNFPILDISNILDCLRLLGIDLTIQDFSSPSPQKIQETFSTMIMMFMGCTNEDIMQPNRECLNQAIPKQESQDSHKDSITRLNVYLKAYINTIVSAIIDFHTNIGRNWWRFVESTISVSMTCCVPTKTEWSYTLVRSSIIYDSERIKFQNMTTWQPKLYLPLLFDWGCDRVNQRNVWMMYWRKERRYKPNMMK